VKSSESVAAEGHNSDRWFGDVIEESL
jgi:hypothetical protein